ncbi:DUF6512 family protein [Mycobacterium sp. NPDC051804]|uniref:DUF6512 family protein n=1 Tax=Mycobacterium sp. NPDC051804 TaxID=3364295 RepID=UPI00378A08C0
MQDHALTWDLAGIPVVIVAGTLLHFCFDWSGRRRAFAVLCPINESVWEHLKMAYWPLLFLTATQSAVGAGSSSLPGARAVGFYAMCVVMLGLYFLTTALLSITDMRVRLIVDGSIFIVAVVVGQLASYAVTSTTDTPESAWRGLVALLVPVFVFMLTTFAPPRLELFRDQITGGYGISRA